MDGRRYYPVCVFEADASALLPWPPQSRLWRAYVMGYLDFMAGGDNPAKVPGLVSDKHSEAYAYAQGVADATAGIAVPFINEVAPPPVIPEPESRSRKKWKGGMESSEANSPEFIAGGDNG